MTVGNRMPRRPKDANELGRRIVDLATGEAAETAKETTPDMGLVGVA